MTSPLPTQFIARMEQLLKRPGRCFLGLVGPPGCGKSTLASAIHAHFASRSVVVPMDGFHLANAELKRLGRDRRKGAVDTFDSAGFVALLKRIKNQTANETIYAPAYLREIEEAVAGSIAIEHDQQLIITEGNYLLLTSGHWAAVKPLLDEVWYIQIDPSLRRQRLLDRHIQFGRSPQAAAQWIEQTDDPNAQQIEQSKDRADVIFQCSDGA